MAISAVVTRGFIFSAALVVTAGYGASAPTPTPTTTTTTQTFQGFGGGFLGPHHQKKRDEIYANAQLYGAPPVYRFNKRELLPKLVFAEPPPVSDPLLAKAANAPSAVKLPTIWMKFRNTPTPAIDPEIERKRKRLKRLLAEDEVLMMLL